MSSLFDIMSRSCESIRSDRFEQLLAGRMAGSKEPQLKK